ncbi:MAG TPA: hypothetical protein VM598_01710 [Bdellovibrionota bacterium]|nr:hypothetical protein [Bdellovibrionota bacterium]
MYKFKKNPRAIALTAAFLLFAYTGCESEPGRIFPLSKPDPTHETGPAFSDKSFDFIKAVTESEVFARDAVARAYRGILQREADPGGHDGWASTVRAGRFGGWIGALEGMSASDEAADLHARSDNRQILEGFYRGFLERDLDAGGARNLLPLIRDGKTLDVLKFIATSDEFVDRSIGFATFDPSRASELARRCIAALYGRSPEGDELDRSADGLTDARKLYALLETLAASAVFQRRLAAETPAQLVRSFHSGFLGRDPSADELARYETTLQEGHVARAAFAILLRPEFFSSL